LDKPPVIELKRVSTSWRKMAAAIFQRPVDGKLSGFHDADLSKVKIALKEWNAEGHRVTILHFLMCVMSRVLHYHVPELNCYAQWGGIKKRPDVSISTAVMINDRDLTTLTIRSAATKTILELSKETNDYVKKRRSGQDDAALAKRNVLSRVPWPFRSWLFQFMRWFVYEFGGKIPGTGFSTDMFGSLLITNIGSLGLQYGIPALMPASNLSFVLAMGKIYEKPVVIDGEIAIRTVLPLSATFDHRVVDGAHVGRMVAAVVYYFENPQELLHIGPPSKNI